MPSSFSHAIGGLALGTPLLRGPVPRRYWWLAAACATVPDLDYLWSFREALPNEHWLAHRGLTHSLIFAVVLAALLTRVGFDRRAGSPSRWSLFGGLALATASHGFLDSLSTYGAGVAFFLPVTSRRYFFPWRPIYAGPGPHDHGLVGGLFETIGRELLWIWLPALILLKVSAKWRRRRTVAPDN